MKKLAILAAGAVLLLSTVPAFAAKPDNPPGQACTTIPSGNLLDSMGNPITPGYNQYGYNYQARITNQGIEEYCQQRNDIPVGKPGHWDYDDCLAYFEKVPFELVMKWNDAWLSNKDCDGDGLLDRHYDFDSYIGSGAWLTNHQRGTYEDENRIQHWNYFVKIVAVPLDAYYDDTNSDGKVNDDELWHTADGVEIGPSIWGAFAIVQEIYNDTGTGEHGLMYLSPASPGFGFYKP